MLHNNPNYAVRFNESVDYGNGPSKAFPFLYSFIDQDRDTWEVAHTLADSLGVFVAATATVRHSIQLDYDYNFKLLWIKYSAYYNNGGTMEWWENVGGAGVVYDDWFAATPYINYIDVSLSYNPGSRYLYGGFANNPLLASQILPIDLDCMQGNETGYGQLRTPYFLPREGQMIFEITNTHPTDALYVAGIAYGMKVRL